MRDRRRRGVGLAVLRLLALPLLLVLIVRLLLLAAPLLGPRQRQALQNMAVAIDVAGGLIMVLLIVVQLLRREWLGAALIAFLAVPVFIGAYRALPAWWWGSSGASQEQRTENDASRAKRRGPRR